MKKQQKKTSEICKGQIKDLNSRTVFKDPVLCAQFLRDYVDIPMLKNVQPEDIEDVSEKYQAYLGISFETDTVKQIHIRNNEVYIRVFLVSLIEHKSQVDYNVTMQLLKYMVCIWNEYAREMKANGAGNSKNKSFKYPPILPIVYYEGADEWTVDLHLKDRIMMSYIFAEYIPDFSYKLVRTHDYTNEELLDREDEMSLLMMINKVQTPEDMEEFLKSQQAKIACIIEKASEPILEIIASAVWSLCMKMNMPQEEAKQCVEKVRERQMGYWFENMEKMDIQAERRNTAEARREAEQAKKELEEAKKVTLETAIKIIISFCMEYNEAKEVAIDKIMEKCNLNREIAEEKVKQYWKE